MGIPSFFRHIVVRYNNDVLRGISKSDYGRGLECTRLFIDFNCILHKCAQQVSSRFRTLPKQLLEEMIMNDSIRYVEYIRSIVKPQEMMYIAIDGVCPRAKMVQQRKRRYISSMRKRLVEDNPDYQKSTNLEWNSNAITPGTLFMTQFDKKIKNYYKDNNAVMISGSGEFGEGEHKIYNYIKDDRNENRDKNDIIYGLDADLILLSMLNLDTDHTICLLRETPEFGGYTQSNDDEFCLLDVNRLYKAIETYYNVGGSDQVDDSDDSDDSDQVVNYNKGQFIRDYIILCTFLGNDFLPPLSYIKVKDNGIDYIIQTYKELVDREGQYLVDAKGTINDGLFLTLLKVFSSSEDENMSNACKQYFSRRVPYCHLQSYRKTFWELDNYPSLHKMKQNSIDMSKKGWRTQYYNALFGKDIVVTDLCKNYLEGIKWVVDYYVNQAPLLDWAYKYSYSPTIMDLMNHLQFEMRTRNMSSITSCTITNTGLDDMPLGQNVLPSGQNITPSKQNDMASVGMNDILRIAASPLLSNDTFKELMSSGSLQLLLVLPPCSKDLIPDKKKAQLMSDISLGCLHFFPTEFKISTFLKSFIWECSAILPDIDIKYLYGCFLKADG